VERGLARCGKEQQAVILPKELPASSREALSKGVVSG
jgi:hypothetical protein